MPIYDNDEPEGYYIASPEEVSEKIVGKKPYIDKMRIWFSENPHHDIEHLRSLCGSAVLNARGKVRQRKKVAFEGVWCDCKLDVSQPTRAAFDYLIENTRPPIRHFVNSVEISLDFVTATDADLRYVRSFFERHWVKLWHVSGWYKRIMPTKPRKSKKSEELIDSVHVAQRPNEGTIYYQDRKAGVHYKMYSDFASKVNLKPCCHLEVTLQGYPNVKNADLDSLESYQRSGVFHKFWRNHLQLRKAKDEDSVREIITKEVRKKMKGKNEEDIRREINMIFRACYHGEDSYIAQDIVDYAKEVSGREKLLEEVSNGPFLPSRAAKIPLKLHPRP